MEFSCLWKRFTISYRWLKEGHTAEIILYLYAKAVTPNCTQNVEIGGIKDRLLMNRDRRAALR
jgi:peroxiredoxin